MCSRGSLECTYLVKCEMRWDIWSCSPKPTHQHQRGQNYYKKNLTIFLFEAVLCAIIGKTHSAPKERRRRRAGKRLSKRAFLESPFLLRPLKVRSHLKALRGQRRNGLSKNALLDDRFPRTTPSPLLWRTPNLNTLHLDWKRSPEYCKNNCFRELFVISET